MTLDEYRALIAKPGVAARNPDLSSTPVRPRQAALVESAPVNVGMGAAPVQAPSGSRFRVCLCSVRNRLLDEDNLSAKYLVDQLRYSGIIPNDNPALTSISVTQKKCVEGEPEHVAITIERIPA